MKFSVYAIAALAAATSSSSRYMVAATASRNREVQQKTSSSAAGDPIPLSSGDGGTEFATSGVQVPLSSGDGGTGDATLDISGQQPALPSGQGSSGMTQRKIAKGSKKNQPMYRKELWVEVMVPKATELRDMEARVIEIVLNILTGQQDKDNDNERRGLVILFTEPAVTTKGTTETDCADPTNGALLACYDTTITIDSEEKLEGIIPALKTKLDDFVSAKGIIMFDSGLKSSSSSAAAGQPGAKCKKTEDCAIPTGLAHPVCRKDECQSGLTGASCGVDHDCVYGVCNKGFLALMSGKCKGG